MKLLKNILKFLPILAFAVLAGLMAGSKVEASTSSDNLWIIVRGDERTKANPTGWNNYGYKSEVSPRLMLLDTAYLAADSSDLAFSKKIKGNFDNFFSENVPQYLNTDDSSLKNDLSIDRTFLDMVVQGEPISEAEFWKYYNVAIKEPSMKSSSSSDWDKYSSEELALVKRTVNIIKDSDPQKATLLKTIDEVTAAKTPKEKSDPTTNPVAPPADPASPPEGNTDITKVDPGKAGIPKIAIEVLIANILNIFYFAIGVVSVIVIIIAGFTMVTSGHNPTSVAKARNAILFASIGIIIVIGAFAMTQFIVGRF